MASYEDSEVYKLAKQMAVEIHRMTLNELPKFEMYDLLSATCYLIPDTVNTGGILTR